MNLRNYNALTLVELLFAVALVGVLILGLYSIETYSRTRLASEGSRMQLQDELSVALADMSKNIMMASGNASLPGGGGIETYGNGFEVWIDVGGGTLNWIRYRRSGMRIQKRIQGGSWQDLTGDIVGGAISNGGVDCTVVDDGTGVQIELTARARPNQSVSISNPEVEVQTTVYSRSASSSGI